MLGFGPEHKSPLAVGMLATVAIGAWASLDDWSGQAIHGAAYALTLLVGLLMYRAEARRDAQRDDG